MYFLRQLKKIPHRTTKLSSNDFIMLSSKASWLSPSLCGRTSYEEKAQLETFVRCAYKIIGLTLPTIESVYHTRCVRKLKNNVWDITHPANHLFELLQSGMRYRSVKAKTTRFRKFLFSSNKIHAWWGWIVFQMNACNEGTHPFITF